MEGRFDEARELIAAGRATLLDLGLRVRGTMAPAMHLGFVELLADDPSAAVAALRSGYDTLAEMGEKSFLSTLAANLAEALYAQGAYSEAERFAAESEASAARDDVVSQVGWRRVRAKLRARDGEADDALRLANEAVAFADRTDMLDERADARVTLADVLELGRLRRRGARGAGRGPGALRGQGKPRPGRAHEGPALAFPLGSLRRRIDRLMSAPASRRPAGRPDPGHGVPGPAADAARPAPPPGCGDHLAAGPRPGGVRVPALDRADPRLAAHVRGARVRDRLPAPARDHVAGERASDRQRRRLHPPRSRHGARRLVEHERLVDLRGHRGRRAALEARDRLPRAPHLQPVELRARPLLPPARRRTRADPLDFWWGPMSAWMALALAIIVVGGLAILSRLHLLEIAVFFWIAFAAGIAVLAASGHAMTARWHLGPDHGLGVLAGARLLARDPGLPLLHDHRPEDDPCAGGSAPGLRGRDRAPRRAPDRAADDRVLDEGRRARGARDRLRRPADRRARSPPGPGLRGRTRRRARGRRSRPRSGRRRSPGWSSSPASRRAPTRRPPAALRSGRESCRR